MEITQEFISLYAPHNAKNLTQPEIAAMQTFNVEQVKALAKAYPNNQNTYLIFKDTSKEKQIWPLGTWQNLLALWEQGQKHIIAFTFRSLFSAKKVNNLKVAPLQDLTKQQVQTAVKETQNPALANTPNPAPVQTVTPGKELTAAEIAELEAKQLEGGNGANENGGNENNNENTGGNDDGNSNNDELFANTVINVNGKDKPIKNWNKTELTAEYVRLYAVEPSLEMSNKELTAKILDRAKPNS